MRALLLLWAGSLALGLCGCAGYKLGPTNAAIAGARSIQVNLFQNQTVEPRLVEAIGSALRKNLQQDGTYRLSTRGEADLVVSGVITRFDRSGLSFQPGDVLTARDFSAAIVAKINVMERSTGKTILTDRDVAGRTTVRVGADLPSAERQALPLLADDLAKNITSLLVEGTW